MENDETSPNARWNRTQRELERLRCKRQALQAQQLDASSPNEGTAPYQPTKSALQAANSFAANRNARIKSDARKLLDTLQTSDSSVGYAADSVKLLFAKQALRVLSERKAAEEIQVQQLQRRSDTAGEHRLGDDQLQRQHQTTRHRAEPASGGQPHVAQHIAHPRSSHQHDTFHRHARYRAPEEVRQPQPYRDAPTRTSARRPVYEAPSSGEASSWEGSSGSWSGDELPPRDKARSSHAAAHRSFGSASRSKRPHAEGSSERLVRGTVTAEALSALLAAMQSHGLNLTARPPRPLPDAMPPPATSIAVQTGDAGPSGGGAEGRGRQPSGGFGTPRDPSPSSGLGGGFAPGVAQHNNAIHHAQLPYVQQQQQQSRYVLMSDGTLGVVQPIGAVPQLQTQVQPASPQPGAAAAAGTPMGLSPVLLAQPQPWAQQQALPSGVPPSPYATAASPSAFTSPYAAYQASPVHAAQLLMPYSHLRAPPSTPYSLAPVPLSPELPTPVSTSQPAPTPSQLPPYTLPLPSSPAPYLHAPDAELHRYLYHMHQYQQVQPPYLHYGQPYPPFLPPYLGGPTPPPPTPTAAASTGPPPAASGAAPTAAGAAANATLHADMRQHSPSQSVDGRGSGLQPSGSGGGFLGHLGHVAPSHSRSHSRTSLHAEGSAGGAAGQGGGAAGSRRESLQGLDSPASFRDLPSRSSSPAPAAQLRRTASPTSPTSSVPTKTTGANPQNSSTSQLDIDIDALASSRQLPLQPGAGSTSLTAGVGDSATAVTDVPTGRASGPGGHDSGTQGRAGSAGPPAGGTEPRRSSLDLVQDWGARRGGSGGAGSGFLRTAVSEAAIDTSTGGRGLPTSGLRIVTSAQSTPTAMEGEAPDTPTSRKPSFTGRSSQLPSLVALGLPPHASAEEPAGRAAADGQQRDGSHPQPPRAGDAADGRRQEGSTALALTSAILASAQPAVEGAGAAGLGAPASTAGVGLAVVQGLQQLGMGHLVAQRQPSAVVASIDTTIPPTAAASRTPATSPGLLPSSGSAAPGYGGHGGPGAQAGGAAPSLASPTSRLAVASSLDDQYSPRGRSRLKLVGNDDIPSPRTTVGGQGSPTSSGGLFHGQHAPGLASPGSRPQSLSQVQAQGSPSPRHRLSVGQLGYPTDAAPWELRSDAPSSATDSQAVLREASGTSLRAVEASWGAAPAVASAATLPLGHMSAASAFARPAVAAAAPDLLLPSLSPPAFGLGSLAVPLEEAGAGASEGALHRASMASSGRSYAAPAAGVGPGPPGGATSLMDSTPSLARADSSFVRFGSMPRNPSSAPAAAATAPALHIRTGGEPAYGGPSPRQSQPGVMGGPSFRNGSGPSSGTASPHGLAGAIAAGTGGGGSGSGVGGGIGGSGPPPLGAKAASSRTLGDGFLGGLFASTRGSKSARVPTASGTVSSSRTSGTGGGRASSIATRAMSKSGEFESDDEDEDGFGDHLGALGLGSSGGVRGAAGGGSERTTPTLQPAGARSARGSAVGGDDGEFEF